MQHRHTNIGTLALAMIFAITSVSMAVDTAPAAAAETSRIAPAAQLEISVAAAVGSFLPLSLIAPGCEQLVITSTHITDDGWITATLSGETPEAGSGVLVWRDVQAGGGANREINSDINRETKANTNTNANQNPTAHHAATATDHSNISMSGFLRGDDGRRWRIIALENGDSRLEFVDADRLPPCAEIPSRDAMPRMIRHDAHNHGDLFEGGLGETGMLAACDDGKPIDLLVLYTAAARASVGGKAAIEGQITAAVAAANSSYVSSHINARLNLLLQVETDYVSSDFGTDLNRLASPGDGQLDFAHSLRDVVGADMVALIRVDGEYCGIAYLLYDNSPSGDVIPFSVTALSCLSTQTLAHELGHNMGCCHAVGDGGGCTSGGIYPYSVGWRLNGQSGTQFRTIMAYAPGNRIDYFSNPAVNYDNRATGVAIGSANQADNASTINSTWQTISNFRCSRGAVAQADCDANGSVDAVDIAFGLGSDCDGDGALDQCTFSAAQPCATAAARAFCPSGLVTSQRNPQPAASDFFGQAVASSFHLAAVGAPGDDDRGNFAGKVSVYERSGEVWVPTATLYAPDAAAGAQFGCAVVVDEGMVIVGASVASAGGIPTGRVYVFTCSANVWTVTQTIECPAPIYGDFFGDKLALSDTTLAIGSRGNRPNAIAAAGAVFIYERIGKQFTYQQRITAPTPQAQALFGYSLAISGDRLAIGTPFESSAGNTTGAAYVFRRIDGIWQMEIRYQGTNTPSRFGGSVGISEDRLAVGAYSDAIDGYDAGAVFTYRLSNAWNYESVIRPGYGSTRTRFGNNLALVGERLLISNKPDSGGTGVTTLYLDNGSGWSRQTMQYSGGTPSMQRDFAVVGAPYSDEAFVDSGAVRFVMWASDCNSNGIPDRCDIDLGLLADTNGNGIPDACGEIIYDLDGSGVVDFGDLSLLMLNLGECPPPCPYDFSGDGSVGFDDVAMLLLQFG